MSLLDVDTIKDQVDMPHLVSYLLEERGFDPIGDNRMCLCLVHQDRNPSMMINDSTAYCFACGKTWDVPGLVREAEGLAQFSDVLSWFEENWEDITGKEIEPVKKDTRKEYLGPVSRRVVDYWHSLLDGSKREYLYNERLLTDKTIDLYRIGWRQDLKAYTIPFWRGIPGQSEVDIMQFRSTKDSPSIQGREWKYIGMSGHNRPSLMNFHLINPVFNVLFVGTFDAILAAQDGIPALSPNGVSVFLRGSAQLNLGKPKYRFMVPDTTSSELIPSYRLAQSKDFFVKFFPFDVEGKDYTEYRLAGGTAEDFMGNVLGIESPFVTDERADIILHMLESAACGDQEQALIYLHWLKGIPLSPVVVSHTLQLALIGSSAFFPVPEFRNYFSIEEWEEIQDELGMAYSYEALEKFICTVALVSYRKQGGF